MSSPGIWVVFLCLVGLFGYAFLVYVRRLRGKPWYTIAMGAMAMFGAGAVLLGATASTLLFIRHLSEGSSTLTPVTGPNGRYTVQVMGMNPGALDSYRTTVNMWSQGGTSLEIFRSNDDPHTIRLQWDAENRLKILRPSGSAAIGMGGDPGVYCSQGGFGLDVSCGTYGAGK